MASLHQIESDVFDALPRLESSSFHACIADAPYGWSFMSRAWDRAHLRRQDSAWLELAGWREDKRLTPSEKYVLWCLGWLKDVYRVLVPGAYAAIFCGSKSYDLMVVAARLAGFDPQPMIVGITGVAMAQGGAVGKLIDREAGADRDVQQVNRNARGASVNTYGEATRDDLITAPATDLAADFEGHHSRIRDQLMPVALLLKTYGGSLARNAQRWGVAGLNVAGTRIGSEIRRQPPGWASRGGIYAQDEWTLNQRDLRSTKASGRFPGNVLLDSAAAEEVGRQSGERKNGGQNVTSDRRKRSIYNDGESAATAWAGDTGDASRYFHQFRYIDRAPKSERIRGLEHWHWLGDKDNPEGWRRISTADAVEQARAAGNLKVGSNHPTLKGLEFTRWVTRLLLPPAGETAKAIRRETIGSAGRLLVPFSGVLSEVIGAGLAGWWDIVAIEMSSSYVEQGACRWRAWGPYSESRAEVIESAGGAQPAEVDHRQGELFLPSNQRPGSLPALASTRGQ